MTKQERLRAIIGNLKNYDFEVFPTFKIDKQDAEVIRELYHEYEILKFFHEKERKRNHDNYMKDRERRLAKAKERYQARKGAKK